MVDGKQYTFKEVEELSNQVANYFYDLGYRYGKYFWILSKVYCLIFSLTEGNKAYAYFRQLYTCYGDRWSRSRIHGELCGIRSNMARIDKDRLCSGFDQLEFEEWSVESLCEDIRSQRNHIQLGAETMWDKITLV